MSASSLYCIVSPPLFLLLLILIGVASCLEIPSSRGTGGGSAQSAFRNWCATSKIEARKCSLHTFPGGLRGLIALEDIEAGETFLRVPLDKCFVKRGDDEGKWPVNLALQLLTAMEKGTESEFWPYFCLLPTVEELQKSLPIHWEAEEIEEGFSGDHDILVFDDDVRAAVESAWTWRDVMWNEYRYSLEANGVVENRGATTRPTTKPLPAGLAGVAGAADWDDEDDVPKIAVQNKKLIKIPSPASVAESVGDGAGGKTAFTRREFEHALDLVQTRNCCPEPGLHLIVPMFDMLNHDPSASTIISVDEQSVQLKTNHRIPKSSQIFLNYNIDSQLSSPWGLQEKDDQFDYPMDVSAYALAAYGFLPVVEQVSVLLPLDTIRAALLDADSRVLMNSAYEDDTGAKSSRPGSALAICQVCGLQISQPFAVFSDGISLNLLAVLRVLSAGEEERQRLWGQGPDKLRSEVLKSKSVAGPVKHSLVKLLSDELERFLDVAKLSSPQQTKPNRARSAYAREAASVIERCIKWASDL